MALAQLCFFSIFLFPPVASAHALVANLVPLLTSIKQLLATPSIFDELSIRLTARLFNGLFKVSEGKVRRRVY